MSFYLCLDNQMVVSSANGMSKTSYKFNVTDRKYS